MWTINKLFSIVKNTVHPILISHTKNFTSDECIIVQKGSICTRSRCILIQFAKFNLLFAHDWFYKRKQHFFFHSGRVVPNSQQPAELTGYLGRFCHIWMFLYQFGAVHENETYFPLQFIDLKIIWLAQRYTVISSLHWVLGITCRKPLKAWVCTNKIEKFVLRIKEIPFLETYNVKISLLGGGGCPHTPIEGIAFGAR